MYFACEGVYVRDATILTSQGDRMNKKFNRAVGKLNDKTFQDWQPM